MRCNLTFHMLRRRFRTAINHARKNGIGSLISIIWQRLRSQTGGVFAKDQIIEFYDFVLPKSVGLPIKLGDVPRTTINWVIPPFGFGSGGHLNIFRFVQNLENEGFDCRIVIVGEPRPLSTEQARKQINEWFLPINGDVYLGIESAPPAHITIATQWTTAYHVRNFHSTVHRCYFVQDFEPYFYAAGSEYVLAEETYRFGFFGITAGTWLKDKLTNEYGMKTAAIGFSYDRKLYAPQPRRNPTIRRIFFYARPPTQRRGFELGMLVLNKVVSRLPDVVVTFAGWDVSNYHIPFEHLNAGILNQKELADLYCQCDVALVLSFTNLSLLPLELMACGTPVVSNRAPCTEWLLNKDNAKLAAPTVDALADALCTVLESKAEFNRLRKAGLATAAATDWKIEARRMADILRGLNNADSFHE